MGRQGKMHSSPFHVETNQYKYAVENEVPSIKKKIAYDCPNYIVSSGFCRLWNSGGDGLCKEFKCKYYRKSLQCQQICNDCAYSFKGKCEHPKKPKEFNQDNDTARYCCFYCGIQKDRNKFILKKNRTIRRALTRELCSHTDSYNNKKRYIHKNEKKLKKLPSDSREYKYLKSKLSEKERMANEEQEHINRLNEILSKLGGRLDN